MKITEVSFPCSITLAAYGYQLKLLSVVSGDGLLFTADVRKEEIQLNFNNLPQTEQEGLKGQLQNIKDPNDNTKNISETEISTITSVLNRIRVENIALFWDKKNSKTLFYLEVYIDLKNTVSLFDGNFKIDYLTLDFIISTGDKEISDYDRKRKEEIKKVRKSIWDASKKQSEFDKIIDGFHAKEKMFEVAKATFTKALNTGVDKQIAASVAKIGGYQDQIQNQFETIERRTQEQKRIAAEVFKPDPYPYEAVHKKIDLERKTESLMQKQRAAELEMMQLNEAIPMFKEESVEHTIDTLVQKNIENIKNLEELDNTFFT